MYVCVCVEAACACMTSSTDNATPPEIHQMQKLTVQIQIEPNSQFEFVPCDSEKSEFLDLADFGGWGLGFRIRGLCS